MTRLSGCDVVIHIDASEYTLPRCLASLTRQDRPPRSVHVASSGSVALLAAVEAAGPQWVALLRSSDRLAPEGLTELETAGFGHSGPVLVQLSQLPPGPGGSAEAPVSQASGSAVPAERVRAVVPRSWPGWPELAHWLAAWSWPDLIDGLSAVPGAATVAVSECAVAPLGIAARLVDEVDHTGSATSCAPQPSPGMRLVTVGQDDGPSWSVEELDAVMDQAGTDWVAAVDGAARDDIVDATFASKCDVLARSGVNAVLFVANAAPQPRWQRLSLDVGSVVPVVGFACSPELWRAARGQLFGAPSATPTPSDSPARTLPDVLATLTSVAAGRPGGISAHGFRTTSPAVSMTVPLGVPPAAKSTGHVPRGPAGRPALPPPASVPLDMVADPLRRQVSLASPIAPAPPEFSLRVTIGSVDALPFPGSVPLFRTIDGPHTNWSRTSGDALLGYFLVAALADSSSLYRRWHAGARELRAKFGFVADRGALDELVAGLSLSRARSSIEDAPGLREAPSFVVDVPGGAAVSLDPDVVGVAAALGLSVRPGPGLSVRPEVTRAAVPGLATTAGYARTAPHPGDVAHRLGEGFVWGGPAPAGWRPLVRWRCGAVDRYTNGELPSALHNGRHQPDQRATLIGTLGWVLPPGASEADLFEFYHPGRGAWMVSTDLTGPAQSGYRLVRVLGSMFPIPNATSLPLYSSYDRRSGSHRLHVVEAEADGPTGRVNGTVQLAAPPLPDGQDGCGPPTGGTGVVRGSPGARLVVRMVHEFLPARLTVDPWALLPEGFVCADAVGYLSDPGGGDPAALAALAADRSTTIATIPSMARVRRAVVQRVARPVVTASSRAKGRGAPQ